MTTQNNTFFKPHIWLKVERDIPRPIFVIGLTSRERWLQISLPEDYAPETVYQYFHDHYQSLTKNGEQRLVTCYGVCLGYYLHYVPGKTIEYDVSGIEVAHHNKYPPHYLAKAEVTSVDGVRLPFTILDTTDSEPPKK